MNVSHVTNEYNMNSSTNSNNTCVSLCLAVNTNDKLTAQIIASTTTTTLSKHKPIGIVNGQALIRRQLYGKTICTDKWITLQWYGVSVQVFIERIEHTTSDDSVTTLTSQMNLLSINKMTPTVIDTTTVDEGTLFTVKILKASIELEQLPSTTQQIYSRLDGIGVMNQQSVYQHIRKAAHQLQLRLFTYSIARAYYRHLNDPIDENDPELWRILHMAMITSPSVILLTGLDVLTKNVNTESDTRQYIMKQLDMITRQLHSSNQACTTTVMIVGVSVEPDKLPAEHGRLWEHRLQNEEYIQSVDRVAQMLAGEDEQACRRLCRYAALLQRVNASSSSPLTDASALMMAAYKLHPPVSNTGALSFEPVLFPVRNRALTGYAKIRQKLARLLDLALIHPEISNRFGVKPSSGALLYGPPGCGKTWLARAAISTLGVQVIVARGTQLFSKYFGETEHRLRRLFAMARAQRDMSDGDAGGKVQERLLSTLLNEMDGITANKGLFVLACTNRPDHVDSALLRPGRLDQLLHVDLPDIEDRAAILRWHAALLDDAQVDWYKVAEQTEAFTCAGLAQLVQEATLIAIRETRAITPVLTRHVEMALISVAVSACKGMNSTMLEAYQQLGRR
ncbi:P-loop containing nucleoside triphosphate hydrolase protein [Syncephalis plumigaleata]|nr:P-loop containing nucleoside triphosphate hydrolase protein [Syncephalis plumigaleata]